MLFDLATARLIEAKVLLLGASVLARLIAAARDRAAERVHATLADAVTAEQRERLEALLDVAEGEQVSGLERLRSGPRKLTATELTDALHRLQAVRAVGVGDVAVDVPAGRERALARYGLAAKAQTLRRMSDKRRAATLLAALWELELDAADDALVLLDGLLGQLLSQAAREHKDERFKKLRDLDLAARRLRAAVLVLLDPPAGGLDALWAAIGAHVTRGELEAASDVVDRLAAQPDRDGQDAASRRAAAPLSQCPAVPPVVASDRPVRSDRRRQPGTRRAGRATRHRRAPRTGHRRLRPARARQRPMAPARARQPAARRRRA